jgi:membrane protein required for colicin V production
MLLDASILFVLAVSLLVGILRGLVREIMTLLGLAGGIAAAWIGAPLATPQVALWLGKPTEVPPGEEIPRFMNILPFDAAALVLTWIALILGVVLAVSLLSHVVAKAVDAAGLGVVDRTLGALFGVARGLAIVIVIYLPIHALAGPEQRKAWLAGGYSYAPLEDTAAQILPLIPGLEAPGTEEEGEDEGEAEQASGAAGESGEEDGSAESWQVEEVYGAPF